ncbi:hypothetical protein N656DRAFT_630993 [Canariomyces notabilis]|uniref:Uncharacterized protein n=1 Tax=Canariomyces notabilis TaxID=2074819 RepID=A0AAN6TFM4_9PEZI|nr:hypothetical protein N656DRAFT_630993 [Canariomyces arenarius]
MPSGTVATACSRSRQNNNRGKAYNTTGFPVQEARTAGSSAALRFRLTLSLHNCMYNRYVVCTYAMIVAGGKRRVQLTATPWTSRRDVLRLFQPVSWQAADFASEHFRPSLSVRCDGGCDLRFWRVRGHGERYRYSATRRRVALLGQPHDP